MPRRASPRSRRSAPHAGRAAERPGRCTVAPGRRASRASCRHTQRWHRVPSHRTWPPPIRSIGRRGTRRNRERGRIPASVTATARCGRQRHGRPDADARDDAQRELAEPRCELFRAAALPCRARASRRGATRRRSSSWPIAPALSRLTGRVRDDTLRSHRLGAVGAVPLFPLR
jgi:hypothetical protein